MSEDPNKKQIGFVIFLGWIVTTVLLKLIAASENIEAGFWDIQATILILLGIGAVFVGILVLTIAIYEWLGQHNV